MSMPPHRNNDFDDIWDVEKDKSRQWGTDEYFKRDIWDISYDQDRWEAEEKERERSSKSSSSLSKSSSSKSSLSKSSSSSNPKNGDEYYDEIYEYLKDSTKKMYEKKPKRRKKIMSSGGGSFGIGGILLWGFIFFMFCDDDKADKKEAVEIKTKQTIEIVKDKFTGEITAGAAVLDKAKKEYKKAISKRTEVKEPEKKQDKYDPYADIDKDKYGSDSKGKY